MFHILKQKCRSALSRHAETEKINELHIYSPWFIVDVEYPDDLDFCGSDGSADLRWVARKGMFSPLVANDELCTKGIKHQIGLTL
jgi:hypothetical protein